MSNLTGKKLECVKSRDDDFQVGKIYHIVNINDSHGVVDDEGHERYLNYDSGISAFTVGNLAYTLFEEVEQPPISIGESSAGLNGMIKATTKAHTRTAEKTFDNAKFVLASIYAANPISTKTQVAEKIGFVLDSCISQICHLMDWNYELHFDLIYDYIVNKNRSRFADLQFEIEGIEEE